MRRFLRRDLCPSWSVSMDKSMSVSVSVSVLLVGLALGYAPAVGAQSTVRGTVTIQERTGATSKDLANTVVYLDGAPMGFAGSSVPATAVVDMKGREFEPHVQMVRVGGSVAFPNSDPFSHNVFSNSSLGAFDLGLYRSGVSRATTFSRAGVYAIYCNIHARMVNFVLALNTPHATFADRKGAFEMANVPAGTYRLHVWHERTPESVQTLVVPSGGVASVPVTLDARRYVSVAHTDKFGKPYAATRADRY